jgi:glutamate/tyrosine decarboxylase-like PLP-dependent enzyme
LTAHTARSPRQPKAGASFSTASTKPTPSHSTRTSGSTLRSTAAASSTASRSARAAFAGTEEGYIKIFERQEDEAFAFWDYGIELSRSFRALKVWAALRYYGARRVSAAIEEDCRVAAYMAERVRASEEFELLAPVTLGICCFRYVPPGVRPELENAEDEVQRAEVNARLDELNARVMHRVQRGGVAYLSNAVLRGRFALRASITNFRTTRRDIEITLDAVRRAAREIELG